MSELDRKINHLNMLKRTLSTIERRIAQMEKDISKEMLVEYADISGK